MTGLQKAGAVVGGLAVAGLIGWAIYAAVKNKTKESNDELIDKLVKSGKDKGVDIFDADPVAVKKALGTLSKSELVRLANLIIKRENNMTLSEQSDLGVILKKYGTEVRKLIKK